MVTHSPYQTFQVTPLRRAALKGVVLFFRQFGEEPIEAFDGLEEEQIEPGRVVFRYRIFDGRKPFSVAVNFRPDEPDLIQEVQGFEFTHGAGQPKGVVRVAYYDNGQPWCEKLIGEFPHRDERLGPIGML